MLFENEPSGGAETESASISEDCSTNNTHRNEITSIPSNDTSEETLKMMLLSLVVMIDHLMAGDG